MTSSDPNKASTLRLFVALPLPSEIKKRLGVLQKELKRRLSFPSLRWSAPDRMHLTLKFLGQLPAETVPGLKQALDRAVSEAGPIGLSVARLGCFPSQRRPRVLWVGIEGDLAGLGQLHERVEEAVEPWVARDERAFAPHLTLARIKVPEHRVAMAMSELPERCKEYELGEWRVDALELMRSELLPQGARYDCLALFPLRG